MHLMQIIAFAGGSSSSTVTAAIRLLSLWPDIQRLGGLIAGGHQTYWGSYGLRGNLSRFQPRASTMAPFFPFSGSKGPGTHCCCTTASLMLCNEEGSGCDHGIASSISPRGGHSPALLSYLH